MVPRLGPRVGKQDEDPADRRVGKPRHQIARVADMESDICQRLLVDMPKSACCAVQKRFRTEQEDARVRCSLASEMLAPTKSNLQPDILKPFEGLVWLNLSNIREADLNAGQKRIDERRLSGLDRARLDAAKGAQRGMRLNGRIKRDL